MAKKKKKRRKTKKRTITQSPPVERVSAPKTRKQEGPARKSQKKIFLYILLPVFTVAAAILIIYLIKPGKTRFTVLRDSELNVLLVTLDTTRADRIGVYGYEKAKTPNLDALAREGVMFENAYCQVPLTLPSHVSILTGTYPIYHHVHNNGYYYLTPDLVTVAEIFKQNGFKTTAFVASYTVDSRFGVDKGFDFFDDKLVEGEMLKLFRSERKADKVYESFARWLDANNSEKFFSWIHFFDPHTPYDPPSPFKEEFSDRPYDGEVAFMDYYVGKVVEKLKEKNIFEKTLIVLAGDHGEALGEHGEYDHGLFLYEPTMKVPFVIYAKSHLPSGLVVNSAVRLIDIMPSLLEMAKIPVPEGIQGESLLPFITGGKKGDLPSYIESVYPREKYGWSELIGMIDSGWKYIQAPKPELYNLREDPTEEKNLINRESQRARVMREKMQRLISDYSSDIDARKKYISQEELARLSSLGYVGGGPSSGFGKNLPDPKDRTDVYMEIFKAGEFEWSGEYSKAAAIYRKILDIDPDFEWNYINLARAYGHMNQVERGISLLEEIGRKKPDSLVILSWLAFFCLRANEQEKAFEVCQRALKINSKFLDGWIISGIVKFDRGELKDAVEFFEKALKIEPENKAVRMKYAYSLGALGRTDDAIRIYNRLKEEYPEDAKIYSDLGVVYNSVGNYEKAQENLKKAVELEPSPETYLMYAVIMEKVGNMEEAIRYIKLYLETTPEDNTPQKLGAQRTLAEWQRRIK